MVCLKSGNFASKLKFQEFYTLMKVKGTEKIENPENSQNQELERPNRPLSPAFWLRYVAFLVIVVLMMPPYLQPFISICIFGGLFILSTNYLVTRFVAPKNRFYPRLTCYLIVALMLLATVGYISESPHYGLYFLGGIYPEENSKPLYFFQTNDSFFYQDGELIIAFRLSKSFCKEAIALGAPWSEEWKLGPVPGRIIDTLDQTENIDWRSEDKQAFKSAYSVLFASKTARFDWFVKDGTASSRTQLKFLAIDPDNELIWYLESK